MNEEIKFLEDRVEVKKNRLVSFKGIEDRDVDYDIEVFDEIVNEMFSVIKGEKDYIIVDTQRQRLSNKTFEALSELSYVMGLDFEPPNKYFLKITRSTEREVYDFLKKEGRILDSPSFFADFLDGVDMFDCPEAVFSFIHEDTLSLEHFKLMLHDKIFHITADDLEGYRNLADYYVQQHDMVRYLPSFKLYLFVNDAVISLY